MNSCHVMKYDIQSALVRGSLILTTLIPVWVNGLDLLQNPAGRPSGAFLKDLRYGTRHSVICLTSHFKTQLNLWVELIIFRIEINRIVVVQVSQNCTNKKDWLEGVIMIEVETSRLKSNSRDDVTSVKTLDTMEMTSHVHLKMSKSKYRLAKS